MTIRLLLISFAMLLISGQALSDETKTAQFLPAGTKIIFEKATENDFGTVTVASGILEVVYFDKTTALVRMGKFPVLSARVLSDSWVVIGNTDLKVSISGSVDKSRSRHRKWYDKSCWN